MFLQIYPIYNFVRLILCRVVVVILALSLGNSTLLLAAPHAPAPSYEDSLFRSLNKQQKLARLLSVSISDFNNDLLRDEAMRLSVKYGINSFICSNGHKDQLHPWLAEVRSTNPVAPFLALYLPNTFEIPIGGLDVPPKHQIQVLTHDSLLFEIGAQAGAQLTSIGFNFIVLDPAEWATAKSPSVINYLRGMKSMGLGIIFGSPKPPTRLPWSNMKMLLEHDLVDGIFPKSHDFATNQPESKLTNDKLKRLINFRGITLGHHHDVHTANPDTWPNRLKNGGDLMVLPLKVTETSHIISGILSGKSVKKKLLSRRIKGVVKNIRRIEKDSKPRSTPDELISNRLKHAAHVGSVVLLQNSKDLIPIKNLDKIHCASLAGNLDADGVFRKYLGQYAKTAHYTFDYAIGDVDRTIESLSHFDIVFSYVSSSEPQHLRRKKLEILSQLQSRTDVVLVYSGELSEMPELASFKTLLWTPSNTNYYAGVVPQSIFGAEDINGGIPPDSRRFETVYKTNAIGRLKYATPEALGLKTDDLVKIDLVIKDAIETGAIPGCQVLMAKNGTVVYHKSFGYFTYDSLIKVEPETVYDIASITKVTATVPSLMFLHDWNKVALDGTLSQYDSFYEESNKADLRIKDILMHQAGLQPHLPFWKNAVVTEGGDDFRFKVPRRNRRRWRKKTLNINWNDSIKQWITNSKMIKRVNSADKYPYAYSDLGFILLKDLAEVQLNQDINGFLRQNLFDPLGMNSTYYQPLCQLPRDRIAPTEDDDYFRNTLIWGTVHDQNAALSGGIGGHAGLFSTANDLAKYMQMLLQNGYYGDMQFFQPKTIELFTTRHSPGNRRALGWDTPDRSVGNASQYSSPNSFGHTGFTGTSIWADPQNEVIFVFLSNRIYPDAGNYKLIENNIRTTIQDILYESILKRKAESQ